MYEENKYNINWFKIGLRLVIVLLVILLSVKLISLVVQNRANEKQESVMTERLKNLDTVGKEYFKENVPKDIGDSIVVSLQDLIDKKLIEEIKDTNDKICDNKESYIKITRLDNQYQIKTNLVCDSYNDYINSFIDIENKVIPIETTSTTTTKKVTTTKKTTTSITTTTTKRITTTKVTTTVKKTYNVSFNTNGGNIIDSQKIDENGIITKIIPIRPGYKFIGWFYHGEEFNFNTKVNKDYVLTAKWVKE